MNNVNNKLTYTEYKGSKDIIIIDLHNNYSIIAIKMWNKDKQNYTVELRIKQNTVEKWDLIEDFENLEFDTDYRFINSAILKQVSLLFINGLFDSYIKRFEYELECLDMGNEIVEKKRLSDKTSKSENS